MKSERPARTRPERLASEVTDADAPRAPTADPTSPDESNTIRAMTTVNKRTVLGGQYWAIGAVFALAPNSAPVATLLVAVGAYILLEPRLPSARRSRPFKLLLSAE